MLCNKCNKQCCLLWMLNHFIKQWQIHMDFFKLCFSSESQLNVFMTLNIFLQLVDQFSSVAQLCLTLCNPVDCTMLGFPVHHQFPEPAQTHVHQVSDAIQPLHLLLSSSPPAINLSQHQGLFQWVSSLHQMAKVLEFQLQHQSFQWIFKTDFL